VYNVSCQQNLYVFNQVVFSDESSLNISNIEAVAAGFEIKNQDEENSFFQYKYQVPNLVVLIIIFIILLIVYCKVYCKKKQGKSSRRWKYIHYRPETQDLRVQMKILNLLETS